MLSFEGKKKVCKFSPISPNILLNIALNNIGIIDTSLGGRLQRMKFHSFGIAEKDIGLQLSFWHPRHPSKPTHFPNSYNDHDVIT